MLNRIIEFLYRLTGNIRPIKSKMFVICNKVKKCHKLGYTKWCEHSWKHKRLPYCYDKEICLVVDKKVQCVPFIYGKLYY